MVDPAVTRFFRVDPRLVHATLMNAWVPHLGAEVIIVADRDIAGDPRRRTIFEMSAMDAVEVRFVSEADVGRALATYDASRRIIVIFCTLDAVERACAEGLSISELNIGHVPKTSGKKALHPAVHLGPDDFRTIEDLRARGMHVYVQPLPDDPRTVPDTPGSRPNSPSSGTSVPMLAAPTLEPTPDLPGGRLEAVLEIVNERGLHLRAAHVLANLAGRLNAAVEVGFPGSMVNAKSLLGLTTLGAARGSKVHVVVEGAGAKDALERLRALFESGFDEGRFDAPGRGARE